MKKGYEDIREEVLKKGTKKSSKEWNRILDKWDVKARGHTATARYLHEKYKVSRWWAQILTVRYEYKKGLRK